MERGKSLDIFAIFLCKKISVCDFTCLPNYNILMVGWQPWKKKHIEKIAYQEGTLLF